MAYASSGIALEKKLILPSAKNKWEITGAIRAILIMPSWSFQAPFKLTGPFVGAPYENKTRSRLTI